MVPGSAFANGGATCVNMFVADDAAVIRKAIRSLLSNREDISVVGEASDFRETIQKTSQLHPDLIILDLSMPDRGHVPLTEAKSLLNGAKVLAMTFGTDDHADELLKCVGAVKLLDKANLADQLVPTILELGTDHVTSTKSHVKPSIISDVCADILPGKS